MAIMIQKEGPSLVRNKSGQEFLLGGEALRQALAAGTVEAVGYGVAVPLEGGMVDNGFGAVPALPRGETRTPQEIAEAEDQERVARGVKTLAQQLKEAGADFRNQIEATGDKY